MSPTPTPETKRLTAARFAGVPELEGAFTDFSDAQDISDGEGIKPASVGPHVALLQQSLLAMGYELPVLGADGVYGAETKAAVLLLQVDAGHPLMTGHEWEHIGGIAGPNTMAHFDMFDPGETVGNAALVETGVAASAARLNESPDNPFAGFDDSTSPPSLMVGTQTRRRVKVDREPHNGDVTFTSRDSSIANVAPTTDGFVVGGRRAGTTTIEVRSAGGVLAVLDVTIKDMRRETVNFFFVSSGGAPGLTTTRDREHAVLLTLRLNRVWRRQANVQFRLGEVREIGISASTGPRLADADVAALQAFAVPGHFNVFCVADAAAGICRSDASILLLPDQPRDDGMGVVHAAGHFLGVPHDQHPETGLMALCREGLDRRRVSKSVADIVNP